jgi:hypothetical protein
MLPLVNVIGPVIGTPASRAYLAAMRTLLALALILVPTSAFAFCPAVGSADPVRANANQQQVLDCQVTQLRNTIALQQQKLDFAADLQAQQQNFNQQLRMQKTFDAAQPAVTFPQF